jgi:ABC-type branched-subunit amino acid transport system ATPase component
VRFGGVIALRDISLSVRAGEFVALVGSNGSGKTTLLNAISGTVRYDGDVILAGTNVNNAPPWLRARLGVLRSLQAARTLRGMPADHADQLLTWSMREAPSRSTWGRIRSIVRAFRTRLRDSSECIDGIWELSYMIRGRPLCVLLDEPLAGRPAEHADDLRRALDAYRRAGGCGIVVEHRLEAVRSAMQRVVTLKNGIIVETSNDV